MKSLAITDHGVMYGVIDFFRACVKNDIKPIVGMEAYLAPRGMEDRDPKLDKKAFHMLLLAKNPKGYANLLKIATEAQLRGYYYNPRIDRDFLAAHSEGLVATSGCLGAQVPQAVLNGQDDEARRLIGWYQETFGPENFFLELQYHDIDVLEDVNRWLAEYRKSGHTPVQFLATNDVHYVLESDHDPHDTLLCIQTGNLKTDGNRLRMTDASYHLTAHDEMEHLLSTKYAWLPEEMRFEALLNTAKVASMCETNLETEGYHLPRFPVPDGHTEQSYLRYLTEKGRQWRYQDRANDPVYVERMEHELNIIHTMGFDTYFLIVWDLCEFARHADIWWNVRGSGAGSLVAYCLGITNLDPIQNSLIFERFLNPGRNTMPDVDLDYPDDRRNEMIEYTAAKYGSDKVASIITFGTMGAKAAIRDVGRALNVPLSDVNYAVGMIPTEARQKKIEQYVDANPELSQLYRSNEQIREVIDTAKVLQGVSRHASTHAAGVIVADRPLVDYLPLHRLTRGDDESSMLKQVTQFPMETCESLGLLKVDFLGLSTLTIMRRASDLIFRHHKKRWTMDNIPYRPHEGDNLTDDQQRENQMLVGAFEMMGEGNTVGVFQVESPGMQQMLRGMKPKTYEHIVAGISLYRPGPMDFIPNYNDRMHGKEEPQYLHKKLEPILAETYGICITGDSIVFDALTGQRYRVDELEHKAGDFYVQSVDETFNQIKAKVTHWHNNGVRDVYRITLKTGATIKATKDHKFLTESGWVELQDLSVGCFIGTPPQLLEPEHTTNFDRDKLRVLAYLVADGSLASGASVDFINKDPAMIEEYVSCLDAFDDVMPSYTNQIRKVMRVGVRSKYVGKSEHSLLRWMRELGLKKPANVRKHPCGVRSHEKSIPDFVFQLDNEDVKFILASLWDCDGYIGRELCHYKTISKQLALDVQTLLLRVGFSSTIHTSNYTTSERGRRTSYQVTLYDVENFVDLLCPHMITEKRSVVSDRSSDTTINRQDFVHELDTTVFMSRRKLMDTYGIDRQNFSPKRMKLERISARVVRDLVEQLPLPETVKTLQLNWDEIVSIEPVGQEHVYDLTVEKTHNFIANGIIVHNCVYQEQIMQIASEVFGYAMGEADLMRRAVSKKKAKDLAKHKSIFMERGPENGVPSDVAEKIFDDIEFFANYGFNKCLTADTRIMDAETGAVHTIGELYEGRIQIEKTVSLDTDTNRLVHRRIEGVMFNGVKPVWKLMTATGRKITATANHPFYTPDGWKNLGDLKNLDVIAVDGSKGCVETVPVDQQDYAFSIEQIRNGTKQQLPARIFQLENDKDVAYLLAMIWESSPGYQEEPIKCKAETEVFARQISYLLYQRFGVKTSIMPGDDSTFWVQIADAASFEIFCEYIKPYLLHDIDFDHLESVFDSRSRPKSGSLAWENDIFWDSIVAIYPSGEQPTYDLTIEGTHNFVANDIIVHNSHAADYAMVTVQTGFLKCHYPAEYMAALLSVYREDTTRVSTFLEECGRLQISILPPSVNYSQIEFDIQTNQDGTRGIRFGMAAIKNAGVGQLQIIIDAREKDGLFKDLTDFCQRVDLRQVGKRTLESLVKVGALDDFADNRNQLMKSIERMVSYSGDHHHAKDVGQISMFGADSGMADEIRLPASEPLTQRAMLEWERELLGFYVTDHPVDEIRRKFDIKTLQTFDLRAMGEFAQDRPAAMVVMISDIRELPTKKGDMMAILSLEDRYGTASGVLFPRTWDRNKDTVRDNTNRVVLVRGKVDVSRGDPQVIVDTVTTEFDSFMAEDAPRRSDEMANGNGYNGNGYDGNGNGHYRSRGASMEEPPPQDWSSSSENNDYNTMKTVTVPADEPIYESQSGIDWDSEFESNGDGSGSHDEEEIYRMVVYIQTDGLEENKIIERRVRRIHGQLTQFHGNDPFSIVIEAPDKSYRLDFPSQRTRCCDELVEQLTEIVGENNIEVFNENDELIFPAK